jgi:hypothetical protein
MANTIGMLIKMLWEIVVKMDFLSAKIKKDMLKLQVIIFSL